MKDINRPFLIIVSLISVIGFLIVHLIGNQDRIINNNLLKLDNFPNNKGRKISLVLDTQKKEQIFDYKNKKNDIPLYFSITNLAKRTIQPAMIINGKDWSSDKAIIETIIPDGEPISEEEKAIRLTNYFNNNTYHFFPPSIGENEAANPVALFNIFGYGWCSDYSYALAILGEFAGLPARVVYLNQEESKKHVVTEFFYQNNWHMFDTDRQVFYRKSDGTIASVIDLIQNPKLINPKLVPRDCTFEHQLDTFSNAIIQDQKYKDYFLADTFISDLQYKLEPREEIRFYYDWKGSWFWADYAQEPPYYTNGLLISTLNRQIIPKDLVRNIELPYTILGLYIYGNNICRKANDIFFSLDKENWINLNKYCQNNVIKLIDVFPKRKGAKITNQYFLKFNKWFSLSNLHIYTQFQVAPNSIPKLQEGENKIELKDNNRSKLEIDFAFK